LPNGLHVEWTERAARAGKSVLCEKPIGLSVADVERLIALRDELGVFIAEAWMPAHHPQWAKVREIVSGGGIGRLHTVTGVFTYGLSDPANVRNSADLGGGALRDVGVYPVGTFRFATGLEPVVTGAEASGRTGSTPRHGSGAGGRRPVLVPRLHAHDETAGNGVRRRRRLAGGARAVQCGRVRSGRHAPAPRRRR
jgi:predicted dehydrogenase